MIDYEKLLLAILEAWEQTDGYDISGEMNEALERANRALDRN